MLRNMHSARAYMYYAMEKMGYAARAPHAYLPMLLCDRVPSERAIALLVWTSTFWKESVFDFSVWQSYQQRYARRNTSCHNIEYAYLHL